MTKLAFYFSQHGSLGHTTRAVSILDGIKREFKDEIDIVIFHNGGKKIMDINKYGTVVDLPFSFGKEYFNRKTFQTITKKTWLDNIKKRYGIIKKTMYSFKPDILITEYFPYGSEVWSTEIPPILNYVKNRFSTKIVASLGYPDSFKETGRILKEYYDLCLFHFERLDVEKFKELRNLDENRVDDFIKTFNEFPNREFTGYVIGKEVSLTRKDVLSTFGVDDSCKLVVVSRGGRADFPKIISSSLSACDKMRTENVYFIISTGPSIDGKKFLMYKKISGKLKNTQLIKYSPNFFDFMNAADLTVNMTGYNTSVEIMKLRKKCICIPEDDIEQLYRAQILKELGLAADILNYNELSGDLLKKYILKNLERKMKSSSILGGDIYKGAENTAKALKNLLDAG